MPNINDSARRSHGFRNLVHTILLVVGCGLLMGVLAYSVLGVIGLIGAGVFGAIAIMALGRTSPAMVLKLYKARALSEEEAPELHDIVHKLSARADLATVPKLYYIPSQIPNAFAVGTEHDSAIGVSDGILRIMDLRQMTGILGHETAHIMNGDLRVLGLADVLNRITSFISSLGLMGIPMVFGVGINIPFYTLVLMMAAPTLGSLLQLGLSRAREYDADLDGATLTGDPEGLASALKTLENKFSRGWEGMVLPGGRMSLPSLLRTHPTTEHRIARLLAVRETTNEQIVIRPGRPRGSIVPQVPLPQAPQVRWHRLGVYY